MVTEATAVQNGHKTAWQLFEGHLSISHSNPCRSFRGRTSVKGTVHVALIAQYRLTRCQGDWAAFSPPCGGVLAPNTKVKLRAFGVGLANALQNAIWVDIVQFHELPAHSRGDISLHDPQHIKPENLDPTQRLPMKRCNAQQDKLTMFANSFWVPEKLASGP